jgi:hypothetical protein
MTAVELDERERAGPDPAPALVERIRRGVVGDDQVLAGPVTAETGPSWLPPALERLRDFHLPGGGPPR